MKFLNYEYEIYNNLISIPKPDIHRDQNWAVIGNNGSGINLRGKLLSKSGKEESVGYISFEKERKDDETDFLVMEDPGTLVKEFLTDTHSIFNIDSIRNRGFKYLSKGETTLLYVSHIKEDYTQTIKRELHLIPTKMGSIGTIIGDY